MNKILLLLACGVLNGCVIGGMNADQIKALEGLLSETTACVYLQGSGGAGAAAVPVLGGGGGYGQGSLSIARSGNLNSSLACSAAGASISVEE